MPRANGSVKSLAKELPLIINPIKKPAIECVIIALSDFLTLLLYQTTTHQNGSQTLILPNFIQTRYPSIPFSCSFFLMRNNLVRTFSALIPSISAISVCLYPSINKIISVRSIGLSCLRINSSSSLPLPLGCFGKSRSGSSCFGFSSLPYGLFDQSNMWWKNNRPVKNKIYLFIQK